MSVPTVPGAVLMQEEIIRPQTVEECEGEKKRQGEESYSAVLASNLPPKTSYTPSSSSSLSSANGSGSGTSVVAVVDRRIGPNTGTTPCILNESILSDVVEPEVPDIDTLLVSEELSIRTKEIQPVPPGSAYFDAAATDTTTQFRTTSEESPNTSLSVGSSVPTDTSLLSTPQSSTSYLSPSTETRISPSVFTPTVQIPLTHFERTALETRRKWQEHLKKVQKRKKHWEKGLGTHSPQYDFSVTSVISEVSKTTKTTKTSELSSSVLSSTVIDQVSGDASDDSENASLDKLLASFEKRMRPSNASPVFRAIQKEHMSLNSTETVEGNVHVSNVSSQPSNANEDGSAYASIMSDDILRSDISPSSGSSVISRNVEDTSHEDIRTPVEPDEITHEMVEDANNDAASVASVTSDSSTLSFLSTGSISRYFTHIPPPYVFENDVPESSVNSIEEPTVEDYAPFESGLPPPPSPPPVPRCGEEFNEPSPQFLPFLGTTIDLGAIEREEEGSEVWKAEGDSSDYER